jgi:hypothetical protein
LVIGKLSNCVIEQPRKDFAFQLPSYSIAELPNVLTAV